MDATSFENEFVTNLLLVFPVQHEINKDQISNVIHYNIFKGAFFKCSFANTSFKIFNL